jgi:hypothetical protein
VPTKDVGWVSLERLDQRVLPLANGFSRARLFNEANFCKGVLSRRKSVDSIDDFQTKDDRRNL